MSHAHILWYNTTGEWKNADGTVIPPDQIILTHPTYGDKHTTPEGEAELLEKVLEGLPVGITYELVQDEDYPPRSEHWFVDAWECSNGQITCNMAVARGIHMNDIRKARTVKFDELDNLQGRAVGRGDAAERDKIEVEKQTLRDIPQTFDLTTDTPVQLKAKWPTELPARE
jgi:hypothetical protein